VSARQIVFDTKRAVQKVHATLERNREVRISLRQQNQGEEMRRRNLRPV